MSNRFRTIVADPPWRYRSTDITTWRWGPYPDLTDLA